MPRPLCPLIDVCGLKQSIAMEAALRVWESFYCEGAYRRCERFRLRESGSDVPARLLPNGRLVDGAGEGRPAATRNDLSPAPLPARLPAPLPARLPAPLPARPPRHAA